MRFQTRSHQGPGQFSSIRAKRLNVWFWPVKNIYRICLLATIDRACTLLTYDVGFLALAKSGGTKPALIVDLSLAQE
jgi:hypothetical protein